MSNIPVLIIAGGANSRFSPFQSLGHKGAFKLLGQSLLIRTLQNLIEHDFRKVVLVITPQDADSHFSQLLVEQADLSLEIIYAIQAEPKGMGDAVMQGLRVLPQDEQQRYAVISGYHLNAGEILTKMVEHGVSTVLSATETDRPSDYGILTLNNEQLATDIIEKPKEGSAPSKLKVLSAYVLTSHFTRILEQMPANEYNFESALSQELSQAPAPVVKCPSSDALSLKYPWQLFNFQTKLFQNLTSHRSATAQIAPTAVIDESAGPVYIGDNVTVGHCAKISGPCYLGASVQIGDFALVRECSLEEETHLGCFTEAARSIFGQDVHVHSGYIGDSIIGEHSRVGADFVTANKRLDRKSIGIKIKNKVIDTNLKRLGVLIGPGAQIGIRVGTMPGKIIGPNRSISPGTMLLENAEN